MTCQPVDPDAVSTLFHLAPREAWAAVPAGGAYRPASLETEGFVHLATAGQVRTVARSFYAGREDLVLLAVTPDRLGPALRWEGPAHPDPDRAPASLEKALFPHLYGPLPRDAVIAEHPLAPTSDGSFDWPEWASLGG